MMSWNDLPPEIQEYVARYWSLRQLLLTCRATHDYAIRVSSNLLVEYSWHVGKLPAIYEENSAIFPLCVSRLLFTNPTGILTKRNFNQRHRKIFRALCHVPDVRFFVSLIATIPNKDRKYDQYFSLAYHHDNLPLVKCLVQEKSQNLYPKLPSCVRPEIDQWLFDEGSRYLNKEVCSDIFDQIQKNYRAVGMKPPENPPETTGGVFKLIASDGRADRMLTTRHVTLFNTSLKATMAKHNQQIRTHIADVEKRNTRRENTRRENTRRDN